MPTLGSNDTDMVGYLITTEFGTAYLGQYQVKNLAPWVFGGTYAQAIGSSNITGGVVGGAYAGVVAPDVQEDGSPALLHGGDDAPLFGEQVVAPPEETVVVSPVAETAEVADAHEADIDSEV